MVVFQSYYSAIIRAALNRYEQRIIFRIVEMCRPFVRVEYMSGASIGVKPPCFEDSYILDLAVKDVLGSKTHNYAPLKAAVRRLASLQIEIYNKENKRWVVVQLLEGVVHFEKEGLLKLKVSGSLVRYISDFSNGGYRYYSLATALSLKSVYSMRLFAFLSSSKNPVDVSVDGLKKMLGVDTKYPSFSDFKNKVLSPAVKELSSLDDYKFSFKVIRAVPKSSRAKPTFVRFFVAHTKDGGSNVQAKSVAVASSLPAVFVSSLKYYAGFSDSEIYVHIDLFKLFVARAKWQDELAHVVVAMRKRRASKGYIVSSIRGIVGV